MQRLDGIIKILIVYFSAHNNTVFWYIAVNIITAAATTSIDVHSIVIISYHMIRS